MQMIFRNHITLFVISAAVTCVGFLSIADTDRKPTMPQVEQIAPCGDDAQLDGDANLCEKVVMVGDKEVKSNHCLNVNLSEAVAKVDGLNLNKKEITTDDYLSASLQILSAMTKSDVESLFSGDSVSGDWLSHPELKEPFVVLLAKGTKAGFLNKEVSIDDPNLRIDVKYEASMQLLQKGEPVTNWMGYFDYGRNLSVDNEKGSAYTIGAIKMDDLKLDQPKVVVAQSGCKTLEEVLNQGNISFSAGIQQNKVFIPKGEYSRSFLLNGVTEALNLKVRSIGDQKFVTTYESDEAVDRLSEFVLRRFDPPKSIPLEFRSFANGTTFEYKKLSPDAIDFVKKVIVSETDSDYDKIDLRAIDVKLYNSLSVVFTYFDEGGAVYVYKIGLL